MTSLSKEEQGLVGEAFEAGFPRLESEADRQRAARKGEMRDVRRRAEGALQRADRAARKGDAAAAKHWADLAQRLTDTAQRLANLPPIETDSEAAERLRADLRARLRRLGDEDRALTRWLIRQEIWEEMAEEARRQGAPMPPPMPPRPSSWMDALPEDVRKKLEEET